MTAIAKQQDWHLLPSASPDDDAKVDEALLESFPASDAPPWTLGVSHPHSSDVIDVSRPPSRDRLWKNLLEWLEVAALVPLVGLAVLAVGIPLVLVVRLIVDALSWVVGRIW